jgi:hypothetical protein
LTPPLTVGTQFGLGMAINDGDQLTPGQKGWGGLGAHSIVFGKTPSETALITLGTAGSGGVHFFLSAINPAVDKFSFRANDAGTSIVDPNTAKLTIDGKLVALVASPKVLDATDFTYRPSPFFAVGSHTYSIVVKDTQGNAVTDSGSFITPVYSALSPTDKASSVNVNRPGFFWRVFQNNLGVVAPMDLPLAEDIVSGNGKNVFGEPILASDNLADPTANAITVGDGVADGVMFKFEIDSVINLSQTAGELNGTFTPDDQMPGIPSVLGNADSIAAELVTYIDLPAGPITMGVTSDDGFRVRAGKIGDLATAVVLGQSDLASTTLFKFYVETPGVYAFRTVYYENVDAAHIEWFTVKPDGARVLVNDSANGGFASYSTGVAAGPAFSMQIRETATQVEITWTEPGTVLQRSSDLKTWADVPAAVSPFHPVTAPGTSAFYRLKK